MKDSLRKRFFSLRIQLSLSFIIVLALGLLLLLLMAGSQMTRMTMESFEHEQQVFTLLLSSRVSEPLSHNNPDMLGPDWPPKIPSQNVSDEDRVFNIFNGRGDLFRGDPDAEGFRPDRQALANVQNGRILSYTAGGYLNIAVPIMINDRRILGVLTAQIDLAPVYTGLQSRLLALGAAALGALLLAYGVSIWFATRLSKPLAAIGAVARKMASGKLDVRVKTPTSIEELRALSTTFNFMAERIEQQMAKQREFVANASHELRSPLASLKLRAEALASPSLTAERIRQYAGEMNEEIGELAQMVNELLQLSRAESGTFVPPADPTNVLDELRSCVRTVQGSLQARQQELALDLPDELPDVYIASNDLRMMVVNLLDNASKYSPEKGRICMTVRWQPESRLVIAVQDNGVGIPPQDLARVGERFFRVDRAHTRNVPGAGLGLALVNALVKQYQGTLTLESSGIPGQGVKATLTLAPGFVPAAP